MRQGKKRSCSDSRIQSSSSTTQYVIVPWTTIFVHSMQYIVEYIVVVLLACLSIKMQSQGATDFGSHFRFYLISRHANIMLCTSQQYYIVLACCTLVCCLEVLRCLSNSEFMLVFLSLSIHFISNKSSFCVKRCESNHF